MVDFKPLLGQEREELLKALQANADEKGMLLIDRNTRFAGLKTGDLDKQLREASDREVIDAIKSVPTHFTGLNTLVSTVGTSFQVSTAAVNLPQGAVYNPTSNSVAIRKSYQLGTANTNTTSGGADEVFSFQTSVSAGSTITLNLLNMTNLIQQSAVTIARIKAIQFRLLSATDDSVFGTACTAIIITNNGPAVPANIFPNGGSGLTLSLTTSAGAITAVAIGAAGTGYPKSSFFIVAPQQAGGSGGFVGVATNSSGVPTSVIFITGAGGTGYTDATVPSVSLGHIQINNGGVFMYFDPLAAGFCLTSATAENIKFLNLDGTNAATIETDIIAGTS